MGPFPTGIVATTVPFHDPCDGAKDTRPSVNWLSFAPVSPRNPEAFPHVNDGRATSTISTAPTSATARFLAIHTRRPTKPRRSVCMDPSILNLPFPEESGAYPPGRRTAGRALPADDDCHFDCRHPMTI